jgi:RNA polymerase sigma-70 factor (ECF subfamily)
MSATQGEIGLARASGSAETVASYPVQLEEIVKYAYARIGCLEDAEDVAVEVFETVYRLGEKLSRKKDPRAYLFGIARRKVADKVRERARTGPLLVDTSQDPSELNLIRQMIGQALDRLPDLQRDVLVLKYLHGFSVKEIADVVGKSEAAVNSLLERARASFAEHAPDLIS